MTEDELGECLHPTLPDMAQIGLLYKNEHSNTTSKKNTPQTNKQINKQLGKCLHPALPDMAQTGLLQQARESSEDA